MKPISDKARKLYHDAKPIRDGLRESVARCEACGRSGCTLDVHEICRGRHRQRALGSLFALLLVCRTCHDELGSAAKWPEARQLALLAESRLYDWDLPRYLRLTNPRAMKRIELHEVLAYMKPELLKVEQVAERLQVNRRTVQSWIDSGDLPAIDVRPTGASRALWRIEAADLMAFTMKRKGSV